MVPPLLHRGEEGPGVGGQGVHLQELQAAEFKQGLLLIFPK